MLNNRNGRIDHPRQWTAIHGATILALALMAAISLAAGGVTVDPYNTIPEDVLRKIEIGEAAFLDFDAEGLDEHLDENFTWYRVTETGPQQMVSGREQTVSMLTSFFANTNWVNGDVYRLGMLGNILVQVEVDTFKSEEGSNTVESLSVYEFKDGKRWREFKFYPLQGSPF